jgi:hypothetical protein
MEPDTISLEDLRALAGTGSGTWGINLYPDVEGDDWLEFDSMINLRPSLGNRSRGVDDAATRTAIAAFVARVVRR